MPTRNITPLERAFQLARSGQCKTTADIRSRLKEEGYSDDAVVGRTLMKQLRTLMDDAAHGPRSSE
jgi:hypothetical protein